MSPADTSVTLLWGEDDFLLREAALALLGDVHATEVDAAEWQGGELQDLATPSLFGEPRALLITDARSPDQGRARRARPRTSRLPDPDATLVICCAGRRTRQGAGGAPQAGEAGRHESPEVTIARKDLEPWLAGTRDEARRRPRDPRRPAPWSRPWGRSPASSWRRSSSSAGAYPGQRITPQIVAQQFRGLGEQKVWDLCDRAFSKDLPGAIRS